MNHNTSFRELSLFNQARGDMKPEREEFNPHSTSKTAHSWWVEEWVNAGPARY